MPAFDEAWMDRQEQLEKVIREAEIRAILAHADDLVSRLKGRAEDGKPVENAEDGPTVYVDNPFPGESPWKTDAEGKRYLAGNLDAAGGLGGKDQES